MKTLQIFPNERERSYEESLFDECVSKIKPLTLPDGSQIPVACGDPGMEHIDRLWANAKLFFDSGNRGMTVFYLRAVAKTATIMADRQEENPQQPQAQPC